MTVSAMTVRVPVGTEVPSGMREDAHLHGSVRVLVADDDADLARQLAVRLTEDGYAADVATDGQRALHRALSHPYDVMVLDQTLPALDGLEIVTRLRRKAVDIRILMLTGRTEVAERVAGLDAGADDCLPKPFDTTELMARVRALHRRRFDGADLIPLGEAQLDLAQRAVRMPDDVVVTLSPREFQLLHCLASQPGVVQSRAHLRRHVFAGAATDSSVDTYVHYLRRKLWPGVVLTVHGLGYQVGKL
jgi:two-component system, OmpR family, response regulator QseB